MTEAQKNRLPSTPSSKTLSDQTADDEDIIVLQDEVLLTDEIAPDFQEKASPSDDAEEEFVTLTEEVPVDAEPDNGLEESQDEDVISLMDELSLDEEPGDGPGQSQDEDVISLMDEPSLDEEPDAASAESQDQDEDIISLMDGLSVDDESDNGPGQDPEEDLVTLTDEVPVDAEPDDGLGDNQDEDVIGLMDQPSLDAEPDDGLAESQNQDGDIISLMDEFSIDDESDNGLEQNPDEDAIGLMDQPSVDEEPDKGLWENREDEVVTFSEDPAAEPADEVLELTDQPAGSADETSNMLNLVEEFAEPESKNKEIHNVTDTIDMSAKKEAAALPRKEILPLSGEPDQEVILLDEDIDLKIDEISDDNAAENSERNEPGAAGNLFDFGLQAALADENEDQSDDADSEVELAEISPLGADDGLDSDGVLDEQILEVIEFDEDLAEVENPPLGQTGGEAKIATDDGVLFDDDGSEDVVNVEDLETDSDDSEIENLIQDFFEESTPDADSRDTLLETPPSQLESEIQFPDDFFDDDEFKFTFETKDISDKIDELAGATAERPAAVAPPIFPLSDDAGKPVKSPEEADFQAISEAQLDAAVQRVVERNFLTKIETMIGQAIEKAVSEEILKLKRLLLDKISGEDAE